MTDQDHIASICAAEAVLNKAISDAEATMCICVDTGLSAVPRGEPHYSIEISPRVMPDHLTLWNTMKIGRFVTVYLDGVEVKGVTQAHISGGWVEVLDTDDNGKVIIEGDNVRRKRLTGTVTAEFV